MELYQSGDLDITLIKARLTRSTDFIVKQDPYVRLVINGVAHKTETHKSGGCEPVWNF